ncbi:hypothetical protein BH23CHL4_BH23CHL4_15850 [soil metagenome]
MSLKGVLWTSVDPLSHPLDWWASGGYLEVTRQTAWSLARSRREVKKAIKAHGWNLIGHAGYEELRQRIMDGQVMDKDLL